MSPREHDGLLREGLFKGLGRADAEEEARYVVRYLLVRGGPFGHPPPGVRWRPRTGSPCGTSGARTRQAEKLRNMIAASRHDPDYSTALDHIAIRIQEERRWWPAMLADWDIAVRRGTWSKPARVRGNQRATPLRERRPQTVDRLHVHPPRPPWTG